MSDGHIDPSLVIGPSAMSGRFPSQRSRIVRDYGQVGDGASAAHFALAENGNEYIIKGPSFVPHHPHVAANEWIAARIAQELGLPVLDYRLLEMNGNAYFGSDRMWGPTFHRFTTADLFGKCENKERVYDLIAFDSWICNEDRHAQNLLVREISRDGANHTLLLINDHSHCLVLPRKDAASLPALLTATSQRYLPHLDFVRAWVDDVTALRDSIAKVEAFPEETIQRIIDALPDELLSAADAVVYFDFLVARRGNVRASVMAARAGLPNLRGDI